VSVHFSLAHAFDREEIVQAIATACSYRLHLRLEISRDRPNWFDEGIHRSRIEVIATFNSVTREYLLNYRAIGACVRLGDHQRRRKTARSG